MKKREIQVFIITPLWNFLSPTSGVLTHAKYMKLLGITRRFRKLLEKRGYVVSSVAEMADLADFDDTELVSILQDSNYVESLMANIWDEIDNCEYVTTIPVNIMTDSLVSELKTACLGRCMSLSQLLDMSSEEVARLVQSALNRHGGQQKRKFYEKNRKGRNKDDFSGEIRREPEKSSTRTLSPR